MSRLAEAAKIGTTAREFQISTVLAISSGFILPAIQSAMTLTVHETLRNNRGAAAIGMLALGALTLATNLASVYVESRSLREKGYSNSPVTTGAYKFVEKPTMISLASHAYHLAVLGIINPVNIMTFVNIMNGNQTGMLLVENAMSVATTNAAWNILTDGLILKGKIDPLANKLDAVNRKIIEKITPPAKKLINLGGKVVKKAKPLADRIKDDIHLYFDG